MYTPIFVYVYIYSGRSLSSGARRQVVSRSPQWIRVFCLCVLGVLKVRTEPLELWGEDLCGSSCGWASGGCLFGHFNQWTKNKAASCRSSLLHRQELLLWWMLTVALHALNREEIASPQTNSFLEFVQTTSWLGWALQRATMCLGLVACMYFYKEIYICVQGWRTVHASFSVCLPAGWKETANWNQFTFQSTTCVS